MNFHITKLFVLLIFLVPLISAQYEDDGYYPTTKWYMRAPKSISGLFRRLLGRRKNTIRTGFQGTAIANGPYSNQPSSYYSSFFSNPFSSGSPNSGGSNYPGSQNQGSSGLSGFSSNLWSPSLSSYTNVVGGVGSLPAAGTNYPTYSPPSSGPGSGNPSNLDFHAVLDQFVRSAGLSPTGDQDTSASTIQSKGDSPVFSFKKLYSFPFYLSTDQQQPSDQGFNLQIPYMRKHIRRALHESPFKNPKFFVDKQSIQNWLHPKNWYHGQQALQQSASSIIPTSTNIQWPNGQESNPILGGGHQRLYRGKPMEHNPRLVGHHQQGIPMQASAAPPTIRSPVVPNSGVAPSLATSGSLKPGHHHQAQQGQPKAQIHPHSPISQSSSTSSSSSSSSSTIVPSAPSVASSSAAPINDQTQSQQQQQQQQQGSVSSGQLTDSNILSSQAFITQYLQEHFSAANQKQLNGLNIKDDQEANESQYAPAYYYGSVANKGQQQSSQQGKQHQSQLVSGQEKGQSASGLPSSSSSPSSSTSLVSGDQSSPISSYQVSYSSGGYGTSS